MIIGNKEQTGVVVEAYDHDTRHRVLVVRSRESREHHFFYISRVTPVDFGDILKMNFQKNEFHIRRGNSKLTYKINPLVFPGHLLWELISDYTNNGDQK